MTCILCLSGTIVHKQQNVPTLHTHGVTEQPVKMVAQQTLHTWLMCDDTASMIINAITITNIGRLALMYISKSHITFHFFFMENDCSRNIVGWALEFWTIDAGKWHIEKQCSHCNNALFMWAVLQDQEKWMTGKMMHTDNMDMKVISMETMDTGFTIL
jgi:hypothetical protein